MIEPDTKRPESTGTLASFCPVLVEVVLVETSSALLSAPGDKARSVSPSVALPFAFLLPCLHVNESRYFKRFPSNPAIAETVLSSSLIFLLLNRKLNSLRYQGRCSLLT